jgi:transcriptional regulator with XRE-family HTH domain
MDSTQATRIRVRSPEHIALGRAMREARARRGYSQEDAAFRADLHRNQWGALERGEGNPTFASLLRIVTGLGLPLSEVAALYERHIAEAQR